MSASLALGLVSALVSASAADGPVREVRPMLPWYAAIHGAEVDHDLALASAAFDHAKHLGFGGVRTDIFWHEVEPSRDQWNPAMVAFHVGYVQLARERELDPLVILSGAPGWAVDLYDTDAAAFWLEFEDYVRRVLFLVAPEANTYQLWNEPNHFIDPIDADDDWQLIARAGALVRELDPTATTCVNAMANLPGWQDAIDDWITRAGDFIDLIGVDHYPGTWACCTAADWGPLEVLVARINTPGDLWFGKRGGLMETGFSSWSWLFADEQDQADWIAQALPEIRLRLDADIGRRMALCCFYQLIDVDTGGWGQEAHFGIVHSDGTPKLGYPELGRRLWEF
ncbi:MAG: hypothetical protein QGI46_11040 [Planctomycetota bacterium]|jgi:hypothetical protein|nr:hypothetical protein [Planctomycetota bacterium]